VLARLLMPDQFGLVALALVFADLANATTSFGFNPALIQYRTESEKAASTHFVIKLIIGICLVLLGLAAAPLLRHFYPDRPTLVPALLAILVIRLVASGNSTPESLLQRRLEFKRLMILNVASSLSMTVVAPLLAWLGWGIWSLVIGEQAVSVVVSALGLWTVRPVWRARFQFDRSIAKHYFHFGFFMMLTQQLTYWLDQFDDFWVGTALGGVALGFYSKAYEFARYPRRVVAQPLQDVFFSTYARLQDDRLRLSKAYYRVNSLVVRAGFILSLGFVLVAREFVQILLGPQWLPMVPTFQLMLVYCLLDPLVVTAGRLSMAVGQPQILTRIKALQLVFFVPAVIVSAHFFGIEGVAVAADIMVVLGASLIMHRMRIFVDFSLRRMFAVPLFAAVVAGISGIVVPHIWGLQAAWSLLLVKGATASVVYLAISWLLERDEYLQAIRFVYQFVQRRSLAEANVS
jgi:O-antigen/teichoic acid export membrane protein